MSDSGSAFCERCARTGILVCQYVIPNEWSESDKAFRFAPWVFRYYLCRYHMAAENRPKSWRKVGGKKRVRLLWKPDAEVIEEWNMTQKPMGVLTDKLGWQHSGSALLHPSNHEFTTE